VERCRLIAECKMGLGQINRRGKLLREWITGQWW
jgi:hypothetical protein